MSKLVGLAEGWRPMSLSLTPRSCRWPPLIRRLAIGKVYAKNLHNPESRGFRRGMRCISATVRAAAYYAYTYTLWRRGVIGFNCEAQDGKAHVLERSLTDAPRPSPDAWVKTTRPCQGSHT